MRKVERKVEFLMEYRVLMYSVWFKWGEVYVIERCVLLEFFDDDDMC